MEFDVRVISSLVGHGESQRILVFGYGDWGIKATIGSIN